MKIKDGLKFCDWSNCLFTYLQKITETLWNWNITFSLVMLVSLFVCSCKFSLPNYVNYPRQISFTCQCLLLAKCFDPLCLSDPGRGCTATEMIPATEMTPNRHRNDTYSQSKWSRHKFSEPWLKWTWDFAIYSKFFVYSCKHDSKQRKIEKAIRLITVLYTDFIFKILTFF